MRRPVCAVLVSGLLTALAFALVHPDDARRLAEGLAVHFVWVALPLPVPRACLLLQPDE